MRLESDWKHRGVRELRVRGCEVPVRLRKLRRGRLRSGFIGLWAFAEAYAEAYAARLRFLKGPRLALGMPKDLPPSGCGGLMAACEVFGGSGACGCVLNAFVWGVFVGGVIRTEVSGWVFVIVVVKAGATAGGTGGAG